MLGDFSRPDRCVRNGSENRPPLAAIRVQKEGPVNFQRLARDSRAILAKLRALPSFRPLIAAKDALFLAHFSISDIQREMAPKMGYT